MKTNCKHKRFVTTPEHDHWRYRCKQCGMGLDSNDAVDLLNGELKTVKGDYVQEVHLLRKTNRTQL